MTAANTDHQDLVDQAFGGVVHESLLDTLTDISLEIPRELTNRIGKGTHSNRYHEWTKHKLADPQQNRLIDGQDMTGNDADLSSRLGNYTQISGKIVQLSHSAQAANSVAGIGEMGEQLGRKTEELRRDMEMEMLGTHGSVPGDAVSVAGVAAGIGAFLTTNAIVGATGSLGGFNDTTGVVDGVTHGTPAPLTLSNVTQIMTGIFEEGGACRIAMGTPEVIKIFSDYLIEAQGPLASMVNDNASGDSPMTAYGASNRYIGPHGQVVQLVPNIFQAETAANSSSLYFLDPKLIRQSFLRGIRAEPLGKTGLSNKMQVTAEWTVCVLNEAGCGVIHDIDETAAMTT